MSIIKSLFMLPLYIEWIIKYISAAVGVVFLVGCDLTAPNNETNVLPISAKIIVINSSLMPQRYAMIDLSVIPAQVTSHDIPKRTHLIDVECVDGMMIALATHFDGSRCALHLFDHSTGLGESLWQSNDGVARMFDSLATLGDRCFWIINDEMHSLTPRTRNSMRTDIRVKRESGIASDGKQLVFVSENNGLCVWNGDSAVRPTAMNNFGSNNVAVIGCIPGVVLCAINSREEVILLPDGDPNSVNQLRKAISHSRATCKDIIYFAGEFWLVTTPEMLWSNSKPTELIRISDGQRLAISDLSFMAGGVMCPPDGVE